MASSANAPSQGVGIARRGGGIASDNHQRKLLIHRLRRVPPALHGGGNVLPVQQNLGDGLAAFGAEQQLRLAQALHGKRGTALPIAEHLHALALHGQRVGGGHGGGDGGALRIIGENRQAKAAQQCQCAEQPCKFFSQASPHCCFT